MSYWPVPPTPHIQTCLNILIQFHITFFQLFPVEDNYRVLVQKLYKYHMVMKISKSRSHHRLVHTALVCRMIYLCHSFLHPKY